MFTRAARLFAAGTSAALAVAALVVCAQAVQTRAGPKGPVIVYKQVEDPVTTGSNRSSNLDRAGLKKLLK